MMRIPPAADAAHAHQVVGGKAQQRLTRELGLTDQLSLGQTTHGLDPAKGLLDALAHLQAGFVALVPLDATIHRRVLVLGRHERRDLELSAALDEGLAVIALVGPDRGPLVLVAPTLQHLQRRLALGGTVGMGDLHVHDQPVAVLHEDVAHVAQAGLVALALLEQPGIGVRGAGVGVVAALLPFEVHLGVAPRRCAAVIVLALEAFVRGPGLDQRAVHAEVFVAGKSAPLGAELDALKEGASEVFVEQAFAVGTEGGVVPDLVFDVQAHEPAVEQVVVDGLDQLALAADGEQDLQQQSLEDHFRRHRGAAPAGIHRLKLVVHRRQQRVDHGAQLAQRVCLRHSLFKADVAEHRLLEVLVASHRPRLGRSPMASDRSGRRGRRQGIFQRPVKSLRPVFNPVKAFRWRPLLQSKHLAVNAVFVSGRSCAKVEQLHPASSRHSQIIGCFAAGAVLRFAELVASKRSLNIRTVGAAVRRSNGLGRCGAQFIPNTCLYPT